MNSDSLLKIARSKATAHRMAKALDSSDLKKAIDNLQAAAEKIKKAEAEKAARQRAANLKKLKSMMRDVEQG